MPVTKCDKSGGRTIAPADRCADVIPIALARVHPTYRGMTEGEVRAAARGVVLELALDDLADLTWALSVYARSADSASAAR